MNEYAFTDPSYNDMHTLTPYYPSNLFVKQYFDSIQCYKEELPLLSSAYRYNDKLIPILKSMVYTRITTNNGYDPLYNVMRSTTVQKDAKKSTTALPINTDIFDYKSANIARVLDKCKEQGVPIIILTSPIYQAETPQTTLLQSIYEERSIPYFSWLNDSYFNEHHELFQDKTHLNDNGAHIHTQNVINTLKPYFISYLGNK